MKILFAAGLLVTGSLIGVTPTLAQEGPPPCVTTACQEEGPGFVPTQPTEPADENGAKVPSPIDPGAEEGTTVMGAAREGGSGSGGGSSGDGE